MPYNDLHSIELRVDRYQKCQDKFRDKKNVHLHHGSSPDILPKIIDPTRATTFWLDAHFQGKHQDEIHPVHGECPLLAELQVIFSVNWEILPYLLIDDAHCFTDLPDKFNANHWPTLEEIKKALPSNYITGIHNNIVYCTFASD